MPVILCTIAVCTTTWDLDIKTHSQRSGQLYNVSNIDRNPVRAKTVGWYNLLEHFMPNMAALDIQITLHPVIFLI